MFNGFLQISEWEKDNVFFWVVNLGVMALNNYAEVDGTDDEYRSFFLTNGVLLQTTDQSTIKKKQPRHS